MSVQSGKHHALKPRCTLNNKLEFYRSAKSLFGSLHGTVLFSVCQENNHLDNSSGQGVASNMISTTILGFQLI